MSTVITEASSTALAVAASGTNYGLQVDESTASAVTGLKIKPAAAAGGLALSTISSGTNEDLTVDAKGTGKTTVGGTSSGDVILATGGGDVGIGTASPGKKLDISGTLGVSGVATHGSDIAFSVNGILRRDTSDGSDAGSVVMTGGGAAALGDHSRGAAAWAFGNEHGSQAGHVIVELGNVSGAYLQLTGGSGATWLKILGADGKTDMQGVYDETDAGAANVFVATDGSLRRSTSSARYKTNIEPLKDWRFLLDLVPVTFNAKGSGEAHMGLTAENVAEVEPRLAVLDVAGRPDEVAYTHLTAPMVKAIQALHQQLENAHGTITGLTNRLEQLEAARG